MNLDKQGIDGQRPEDEAVETALRHFRESVHAWSEQEFARPRAVKAKRSDRFFRLVATPLFSGATAAALLIAGAGVPMAVHHERVVAERRAEATARQEEARRNLDKPDEPDKLDKSANVDKMDKLGNLDKRDKLEETDRQATLAMNDEQLMSHVDSDIAQAAPDAMEPLASLMSDAGSN